MTGGGVLEGGKGKPSLAFLEDDDDGALELLRERDNTPHDRVGKGKPSFASHAALQQKKPAL